MVTTYTITTNLNKPVGMKRFTKDNVIVHDEQNWICLVDDDDIAVFAPHYLFIDEDSDIVGRTEYRDLFAVDNNVDAGDGFEYTKVKT